jgi:NADPH:quinone reductase-like Zn-dependent oxidoreductase
MKAIVHDRYGSPEVLRLAEVEKPTVAADEVLVRVRATSVHADVWHVVSGLPYVLRLMGSGLRRPQNPIPGTDLAGIVEKVGAEVMEFQPGDEVFGESRRGMQWINGGTYAEFVSVPADILVLKPTEITFEQAACVPTPGMIALSNLHSAGLPQPGDEVLVNGAGGGVGAIALQLAKAYGATVTAVDGPQKLEMLRNLGADFVIDYTREDFTQQGKRYDLIFDVASNLRLADCKRVLTAKGKYVVIGHDHYGAKGRRVLGSLPQMIKLMALARFDPYLPSEELPALSKREMMTTLNRFLASGQITPLVDRTYPLSDASRALRHLIEKPVMGRLIITP